MIAVESTPKHAGVTITGDFLDFHEFYDALHEVVGDEDEYPAYSDARLRLLALCYDLRHATMGDREVTFVPNGLDDETKRWHGIIAPDKNVYLSFNVLWPELLFYTMALNDFADLRAMKISKKSYEVFEDMNVVWDSCLAQIRMFQAAVFECIKRTVPPTVLGRIRNMMFGYYVSFNSYTTQYLDVLNIRFLELDEEKRVKNISIMVKRLVEQGEEYQQYRAAVYRAAQKHDCHPSAIGLKIDYPDDIDW